MGKNVHYGNVENGDFGNVTWKTVQNSRDHKEQRKFKYRAVGSYLPLLLGVSSNFFFSSELLRSL